MAAAAVLMHGPQPIAEAVANYEASRTPALARANARVAVKADGHAALEWAMQRRESLLAA